jgi:hypothetical protein
MILNILEMTSLMVGLRVNYTKTKLSYNEYMQLNACLTELIFL